MNDNINTFYSDLRKIKKGKFAIFLWAGSSKECARVKFEDSESFVTRFPRSMG